ncbi:MAG TPA: OmpA family protein [Pyrinomonadaceae bacterium]|jgi:outer membrane protein OmpA-like peptidoglycan-associated protein|nr:OmpA family protein [Pyrinomonadaceae bacterium]
MNSSRPLPGLRKLSTTLCAVFALAATAAAQSDLRRETVAITYPLEQGVSVKFRGTTRLPRLKGEAKVTRSGRRGTRVEMSVEALPRAFELGSVYTTYVLWAISPEGRADNLGEIKRGGSFIVDSKIDVTTPLQTFAMIVTAEPHFLVRGPSRMVVLENLPPNRPGNADVATVAVRYLGNTSDYFNQARVPEVADADYARTPTSLLGARQSIGLARFAGADRDAPDELKEANDQLAQAETAWRLKQPDAEVDALARRAISLGAKAEEIAEARKAARGRREEIARRDAAVREAEKTSEGYQQEIAELRDRLEKSERARELSDRDLSNTNQQVRDLRSENARLREELQQARAASEDARVKLARIEGERSVEEQRRLAEQKQAQQQTQAAALRQALARFGTVRDAERGMTLVLSDSVWAGARSAELTPNAAATVEPLAALLANNPDYQIYIEVFTDSRGDELALRKLAQDRASALSARFTGAGVQDGRIQASGMGPDKPVAPNTTPAGRTRNRRAEITLVPFDQSSSNP